MPQPGHETKPPTELRLRMCPDLRARIEGSTARDTFNVPSTFTAKAARTSSAITSSTAPTRPRPALLTRTSIRPNCFSATSTASLACCSLVTSSFNVSRRSCLPKAVSIVFGCRAVATTVFGRIDVLVNNAGRGLVGAVEEVTAEEVRAAFAVNVEGTLNVSRAALPAMRARKSGHVLNLSSVGGFVSWPGWGIYCATKFMVEGFSEAMQVELKPLGIKVTIVEPGPFRTDFLGASSLERTRNVISDYGETAGAARQWADSSHSAQPGDPAKAAAAMVRITEVENPPLRLQLGADCLAAVESKLDQVKAELNHWRDLATSTAFTE